MDTNNNIIDNVNIINSKINFGRLMVQLQQFHRFSRVFGEAGSLTPSEIHTIDAIGCENAIPMSELASRLKVTKGAVTQTVTRLEKKDLVKRFPHSEDSRVILVSLKSKGKSAYEAHQKIHEDFFRKIRAEYNNDEMKVFEDVITKLGDFFRTYNDID